MSYNSTIYVFEPMPQYKFVLYFYFRVAIVLIKFNQIAQKQILKLYVKPKIPITFTVLTALTVK